MRDEEAEDAVDTCDSGRNDSTRARLSRRAIRPEPVTAATLPPSRRSRSRRWDQRVENGQRGVCSIVALPHLQLPAHQAQSSQALSRACEKIPSRPCPPRSSSLLFLLLLLLLTASSTPAHHSSTVRLSCLCILGYAALLSSVIPLPRDSSVAPNKVSSFNCALSSFSPCF